MIKTGSRTLLLTTLAMLAFAANSVLCRLALGQGLIDAASFATVRLVAGAVTLALIVWPRRRRVVDTSVAWRSVLALFAYVACFSFAYLSLSAGTGALVLFGAVQLTMFAYALVDGERFSKLSWFGLFAALAGLLMLIWPGLSAPDPLGAVLMAVAGVAWGAYSLFGRQVADPLMATANNFIFAVPLSALLSLTFISQYHSSASGLLLAIVSGALSSGLGYVVWFAALSHLSAGAAASVQLTVPVIAAFAGVVWLSEPLTGRLILASTAILGGVWLVLRARQAQLFD